MKAFFCVALLLVCCQAAFGFMPAAPVRRTQMRMTAQQPKDLVKKAKSVMAGLTPIILSAPVWATEGTGEVSNIITITDC